MSEPRPDPSVDEILAEFEQLLEHGYSDGDGLRDVPPDFARLLAAAARALRAQRDHFVATLEKIGSSDRDDAEHACCPCCYFLLIRGQQQAHDRDCPIGDALASSPRTGSSE